MKKSITTAVCLLTVVLTLSLSACSAGTESTDASTELSNPVVEVSASELAVNTGISLEAPVSAENASYAYIKEADGSPAIAQVNFTLDGVDYCYRAQTTSLVSMTDAEALEAGQQLSGIYEDFKARARVMVSYNDAYVAFTEKKSGFVVWIDAVPGILYTVSTSKGAQEDALLDAAEAAFVPAQGDSD